MDNNHNLEHCEFDIDSKDLFLCEICNKIICENCKNEFHKDHRSLDLNDQIELASKSNAIVNNISLELKTLNINREGEELKFKNEVKKQHEEQIEMLASHFRSLHDLLHFKEVELKRELQSYYEDNQENYLKLITEYDYNIDQLSNSKFEYCANPIDLIESRNDFIKSYMNLESSKKFKSSQEYEFKPQNQHNQYQMYHVDSYDINTTKYSIESLESHKLFNRNIYYYSITSGFQRINQLNHEAKTLVPLNSDHLPQNPKNYFYYQLNTVNDKLHFMFHLGRYWKVSYSQSTQQYQFSEVQTDLLCATTQSSIYDGKETIYLFGGYNVHRHTVPDILTFNIHTEALEVLDVKLPVGLTFCTLSMAGSDIIIFGGYNFEGNKKLDRLKSIYRFNTSNYTLSVITDDIFGLVLENSKYFLIGNYVQNIDTYYFLLGEIFYCKNSHSLIEIPLPKDYKCNTNRKIVHDGFNTLYLIQAGEENISDNKIFEFNIQTNQFIKPSTQLTTTISMNDYYNILFNN